MSGPEVMVDVARIEENTRVIVELCTQHGIEVTGVTKASCGMPQVAKAMLRGGVTMIGESRLENIHRLRAGGISAPIMLLRIPPLSAAEEIVRSVDLSLNSELSVIQRLSDVALSVGTVHDIILMVDLGDLREGIWPEDLMETASRVMEMEGVRIRGIGTNLTCYGGVIPSEENLGRLAGYADEIENRFGIPLPIISGGNSSSLNLLAEGGVPRKVNNLRIGEAILLGRETVERRAWPGTSQKAFLLSAEIIEKKRKPSVPIGITGQDAFGATPVFQDRGNILRGILNIGREDVDVEGLEPANPRISILGASSDHLLVDINSLETEPGLGESVEFIPNYSALLACMTSAYVGKRVILPEHLRPPRRRSVLLVGRLFQNERYGRELETRLERLNYRFRRTEAGLGVEELAGEIEPGAIPVLGGRELCVTGLEAAAASMNQFGLLWVDSTIRSEELSRVLGRDNEQISRSLDLSNIVLLGVREIEEDAAQIIRSLNIQVFTMEEISLIPMREIIRQSLKRTSMGTEGLYLKFSGRVADNGNDGLTNRETHLVMEMTAAYNTLRVLEIDDDEPDEASLDSAYIRSSREASANMPRFLLSALGKRILPVISEPDE